MLHESKLLSPDLLLIIRLLNLHTTILFEWLLVHVLEKKEGKIIFKAIYSNLYFYTIIEIKYTMVSFFKPACVSSYF